MTNIIIAQHQLTNYICFRDKCISSINIKPRSFENYHPVSNLHRILVNKLELNYNSVNYEKNAI